MTAILSRPQFVNMHYNYTMAEGNYNTRFIYPYYLVLLYGCCEFVIF